VKLVDTSFLVAVQLRRDAHHAAAARLWSTERDPLLLTNHVLGETWTFLRRRADHQAARRFVKAAQRSQRFVHVRVDADTETDAWRWLLRHDEREYSFVDATSFALMRRRRIRAALAFDGDFSAAGFVELRSDRASDG
jgi:predicted nucleic acid-binding protein